MTTFRISGFSTGVYGNLGGSIFVLSPDGDILLQAGDTISVNVKDLTHQERHEHLHKMFEELVSDFIRHNKSKRLSNTSLTELLGWSFSEMRNPTEEEI